MLMRIARSRITNDRPKKQQEEMKHTDRERKAKKDTTYNRQIYIPLKLPRYTRLKLTATRMTNNITQTNGIAFI